MERIDLYQFHWPDWTTGTSIEESWGVMAELVDEGKVRWIGVCNFDVEQLDRCEAIRHVDSLQPPLSLLVRGARSALLPWADDHGTGVIAYSPMASGMLTGSFDHDRVARLEPGDWRRGSPVFQEPALAVNLALVDGLRTLAERVGMTVPSLVVGWVLAQQGVTGAIVGARRPAHVEGWSAAGEDDLREGVLRQIDELIAETGAGTDERPLPPLHMREPR